MSMVDMDIEENEIEKRVREREEELCDLFRMIDRDGSGIITVEELSRIMMRFADLNQTQVDVMLSEADKDGDSGVINY